ncbi:MAG: EutN/CcmL family microcompartment protein [Bacteroidetes bacterium]|nr:EutN/CcmL family microcompartment protein [Bacteroidota bacterium]
MILAKVTGTLVAPVKNEHLEKCKLLIVQPVDLNGNPEGSDLLAIDYSDAGIGDTVLVAQEGDVVKQLTGSDKIPANAIIMGVVDGMDLAD